MSKHTAPWREAEYNRLADDQEHWDNDVLDATDRLVAEVTSWDSKNSNLALIAAAPELLESLEEVTGWMRDHCGPGDGVHEILIKAMAAINKAKGE